MLKIESLHCEVDRAHGVLDDQGLVASDLLREPIARSWSRSLGASLDYRRPPNAPELDAHIVADATERDHDLLLCAQPFMESLYSEIKDSSSLVLLTDSTGMILHATVDVDFEPTASRLGAIQGSVWREDCRGTNAMGIVLADRVPAEVFGPEHFLRCNGVFGCAASPIFDPTGNLRGVLDATTEFRGGTMPSLAVVRLFARMIENQLFQAWHPECVQLHFHKRPQFIGTPWEGIALVAPDGNVLAVNECGRSLVAAADRLVGRCVGDVFGVTYNALIDHSRQRVTPLVKLRSRCGEALYAKIEWGLTQGLAGALSVASKRRASMPADYAARAAAFDALDSGDPQVHATIEQLRRVVGRDISVLIQGETGTGKELLARALHACGPRRNQPFVPVNCASIPEGLIESELFGYGEGAFTGAKRRGSAGKVLQASGGTLFLDEIGDMPEPMQSRLLRVLQEREVVPLGTNQSHKVDIVVICATHRDLKTLISTGAFRKDLYYRLNGLVVTLPALCKRTDLVKLVERICAAECESDEKVTVSSAVIELFRNHPWPGNIRQLHAVLRTAIAMVDDDRVIGERHLCPEFLEDLDVNANGVSSPSADRSLDEIEADIIRKAVDDSQGNISLAASKLGISRTTIYRRLRSP
jgi:sigma-54 dependent transcriptional regulator, acetoin dehydrogenase operon transcriptional activator AcoR